VSISFAALIDRKYGKPSETIGHWPLLNKPDAPREPKFKISAEGDRDEFENGLWPYDPQTRFLAMCRIWGTHLLTSSWSECWVKKHSFFMAENYDHTCHIFKVKAKPLVSKIKATISHPFNRCQVITGGRCLSRGWFCDRRCSTWLGVVIGFAIFNIFVIFRNDVWQIRRFRYPTRMDEWHEPYTYTYFWITWWYQKEGACRLLDTLYMDGWTDRWV
jgi:hypothetical protein